MRRTAATQYPSPMYDRSKPFAPNRCEVCGRPLAPAGSDWASQWYTSTYAPLMDNLTRMWGSMAQPWMAPATNPTWPGMHTEPHQHTRRHDCGCEHGDCDGCGGDRCHCRCCITDADLVVYARLGERRVVPLTIENHRRRERQVKLEISNWSSHGGRASNIKAHIAGPTEFTLAPCQEYETILLIEAAAATDTGSNAPEPVGEAGSSAVTDRNRLDVDNCHVFYADLRVEGCEMRPVRIALALLPRDCAAYKVDCGCNCC
jgi:hypothetical protein